MGECLILKSGGGTDTSDATATKEVILSGYTAYVNDQKIIGEMPSNTAIINTINSGESVKLGRGYYPEGKVTVNSLASQTDANASAAQILNSYTAWVKGSKITGTMPNRGNIGAGLSINGTYKIPAGWHNGAGKVTQTITTQGGSTVTPRSWNQLMISAGRYMTGTVTVAGDGNLSSGNIKNGVWLFGVLGKYTGNVIFSNGSYGGLGGGVSPVGDCNTNDVQWTSWIPTMILEDGMIKLVGNNIGCRIKSGINLSSYKKFTVVSLNDTTVTTSSIRKGIKLVCNNISDWFTNAGDETRKWYMTGGGSYRLYSSLSGSYRTSYIDISSVSGTWWIYIEFDSGSSRSYTAKIVSMKLS